VAELSSRGGKARREAVEAAKPSKKNRAEIARMAARQRWSDKAK
jgi:hypothetical protein